MHLSVCHCIFSILHRNGFILMIFLSILSSALAFSLVINNLVALEELSIFNALKVNTLIGLRRILQTISTFLELSTFLEHPIMPATIEKINIEVSAYASMVYNIDPVELIQMFNAELIPIDDVLCARRFPRLKRVDLYLFIHGQGGKRSADVSNCNDSVTLPRLSSRGLAVVGFTFRFLQPEKLAVQKFYT